MQVTICITVLLVQQKKIAARGVRLRTCGIELKRAIEVVSGVCVQAALREHDSEQTMRARGVTGDAQNIPANALGVRQFTALEQQSRTRERLRDRVACRPVRTRENARQ